MGKGLGVGESSLFSCCIAAAELRISVRLCCHKLRSVKHTETKKQGKTLRSYSSNQGSEGIAGQSPRLQWWGES